MLAFSRVLPIITLLVEHLKGKNKDIVSCLNKLIKNQMTAHQGNPDKAYKPRASRARKNKGGLSPNDLDYELDIRELDEGDKLEVGGEGGEVELLTKKRLRPRKEKVNYFDLAEGKQYELFNIKLKMYIYYIDTSSSTKNPKMTTKKKVTIKITRAICLRNMTLN